MLGDREEGISATPCSDWGRGGGGGGSDLGLLAERGFLLGRCGRIKISFCFCCKFLKRKGYGIKH